MLVRPWEEMRKRRRKRKKNKTSRNECIRGRLETHLSCGRISMKEIVSVEKISIRPFLAYIPLSEERNVFLLVESHRQQRF